MKSYKKVTKGIFSTSRGVLGVNVSTGLGNKELAFIIIDNIKNYLGY
jgi:hypothetical protein